MTVDGRCQNRKLQLANENGLSIVKVECVVKSALIELLYKLEVTFLALWKLSLLWLIIVGDVRVIENAELYKIRSTCSKQMFDRFLNCLEKEVV